MKALKKGIGTFLILCLTLLCACNVRNEVQTSTDLNENTQGKKDIDLNIVTTDKLLYFMVKDIVKDKHNVEYMFKNRSDELRFTFSDDSLGNISQKDLFIYTGAGFEPWINSFIGKLDKSKVGVVNVSRGVKLISYSSEVNYYGSVLKQNPYYIINLDNYKIALLNIKNSIEDKDPKNREFYEKNFNQSLKDLDNYSKEMKQVTDDLKDYTFVVDGDDLDYFIKYNNFKYVKVSNSDNTSGKADKGKDSSKSIDIKSDNSSKLVFLYDDKSKLDIDAELIKKYNMKVINISVYKDSTKYIDILKSNMDNLKKALVS